MASAKFVKAAQKDYPAAGIKKGESYYWWKHRFGAKQFSKTPPKASQLTSSAFLSLAYDLNDRLATFVVSSPEEAADEIQSLSDEARKLGEEAQNSLDNMPEGLQQGSTGELLQGRADAMSDLAESLDSIDTDMDPKGEGESADEFHDRFEERVEEINSEVSALQYEGD